VIGTSRSSENADLLRALGAKPVVLDMLDPDATSQVVANAEPDAIVHEATALAGKTDFRHWDESFADTNRLRTDGTDSLLAAARKTGVPRVVAQSYAGWPYAREGGPVKSEDAPLDAHPLPEMRETLDAIEHLERSVQDAGGVVLRYGGLYGAPDDAQVASVGGGSRSSATAVGSGPSCTWTTPRRRRCSQSNRASRVSTTSSTATPRRSASGCPRWQRRFTPSRRSACRAGSRGSSPGRSASS